jgi:hypothetical protein
MSTLRIQRRVASATAIFTAQLQEHVLKFHKRSVDGSAKCDIEHTRDRNDFVFGVVYDMLISDKPGLDKYEGLGNGYDEKSVVVIQPDGQSLEATAYYATHIDASLEPYHWYKQHVLIGALEHGLPREHVELIMATPSAPDPDQQKHIEELSIYPRISPYKGSEPNAAYLSIKKSK